MLLLCRSLPHEAPGSVMLSDLSPSNKEGEVYEAIEADNEYEILDKYSQAYDDIKIPPTANLPKPEADAVKLQSFPAAGDYEFTQCPAYVTIVATTNVLGNTNKYPSIQRTAAQDDQ